MVGTAIAMGIHSGMNIRITKQIGGGVNGWSYVIVIPWLQGFIVGVVDLIESTGALVVFLPPYSPDLNAIEEAFSKLKITLKANEALLDILDVESLVLQACTAITAQDCKNWITHAGYE